MLEDIDNPFSPLVRRPARPSRPAAPAPRIGLPNGSPVVPAHDASGRADDAPVAEEGRSSDQTARTFRITPDPGPGEVVPPSWWANRGRGGVVVNHEHPATIEAPESSGTNP
jgi:hypothetical protein